MADKLFPTDYTEVPSPLDTDYTPLFREGDDMYKIKTEKLKGADSTVPGPAGNGIDTITTNKVGKTTTVTITETDATITEFELEDGADGLGSGDMTKATYDPTNKNQDIFAYADSLVAGLLDFRGGYDASGNTFPATGGSGTAGAVLKGDTWAISVAGTLGGVAIQVGDVILATVDTPDQITGNWTKLNTNVSYVPEDQANKENSTIDTSTTKYPTVNLLKTGLDAKMANPMTTAGDVIYGGTSGVPTRLPIGTAGQVLKVNTGATGIEWGTGGGSTGGSYMFAIAGTIGATGTNVANTILVNGTKTITSVDLWYGTAGNGTLTVDVNKNGTTLFSTTKPSITATNQGSVNSGTLTTTSLASGDYLTIDIDAIPATTLPVDLYVRVNYS